MRGGLLLAFLISQLEWRVKKGKNNRVVRRMIRMRGLRR